MASITLFAWYSHTLGANKPADADRDEHIAAKTVGKSVVAFAFAAGILTVLGLSIAAALGHGPLAPWGNHVIGNGFTNAHLLITIIGGVEAITILGLLLNKAGFGKQTNQLEPALQPIIIDLNSGD